MRTGADLERPGAFSYRARWGWRVHHAARYIEHGRIFNALTPLRAPASGGLLAAWVSEEKAGLRHPACERRTQRTLTGMSRRAYVSLEDTTAGTIALVVRAHHPTLGSRCSAASTIPSAHVHPAPAGTLLREASALAVSWQEPVRIGQSGPVVGSVRIRVRLRAISQARLTRRVDASTGADRASLRR